MKKIAYLILAHTDPIHLKRLIDTLNFKSDFYIHLDEKSDIDLFLKEGLFEGDNIRFINDRYSIRWAGFNMVLATKALIKNALQTKENYSHLVLISGLDYPLKSKIETYEFFVKNKEVEFIRAFNITKSNCKHCKDKVERYWLNDFKYFKNNKFNKIVRKLVFYLSKFKKKYSYIKVKNRKLDVCFGSQWWAITPNCARYVMEYTSNNKEIDEYFKYSFASDELYFHTIIFNSKFKTKSINKGIEPYNSHWEWSNIHYLDGSMLGCNTKIPLKMRLKNINKHHDFL